MPGPQEPEELAREARLAQAVDARSRRGHWDRLGAEEATLASTLERLAAAGSALRLVVADRSHHGSLAELGPDQVRLAAPDRSAYLRLGAIEVVEADGDHVGPRPRRVTRTFADVLSRQAGEAVTLLLASGTTQAGVVASVGVDLVALQPAGSPPRYVSSSAVVAVLADGSG